MCALLQRHQFLGDSLLCNSRTYSAPSFLLAQKVPTSKEACWKSHLLLAAFSDLHPGHSQRLSPWSSMGFTNTNSTWHACVHHAFPLSVFCVCVCVCHEPCLPISVFYVCACMPCSVLMHVCVYLPGTQ